MRIYTKKNGGKQNIKNQKQYELCQSADLYDGKNQHSRKT